MLPTKPIYLCRHCEEEANSLPEFLFSEDTSRKYWRNTQGVGKYYIHVGTCQKTECIKAEQNFLNQR